MNSVNGNMSARSKLLLAAALLDLENDEVERFQFHPQKETCLVVITGLTLEEQDYIFDQYSPIERTQLFNYNLLLN